MNTAVIRSDWVGRVIDGKFTLLQWLGSSGKSDVFLTELQGDSPRKAAIKLIPLDAREAEVHVAHWAMTTRLSHPHLMRLLYTGRFYFDTAPFHYVVTEFAEETLSQILPERPLTPDEAGEMLDPILEALSYLHRRGFVHGHLKPSNILVVDDQLKLSADSLHVAGELDEHFAAPGVYDAPEVGAEAISPAADVWSLGVTLVETLTQLPPAWDRSTNRGPVVPEAVPQPFAGIAQECLRRDPARRCTLSDVDSRLEPARKLPDRVSEQVSESSGTGHGRLPPAVLVSAVIIILLAVAASVVIRSRNAGPSFSGDKLVRVTPQSPAPETQAPTGALVKGAVVGRALPDVPENASSTIRGQVTVGVRVMVDPGGNVAKVTLDSPGPSKYFARLALQAAQHWKFKPAQIGGQAVSSVWILRFGFRQTGTGVNAVEVTPGD